MGKRIYFDVLHEYYPYLRSFLENIVDDSISQNENVMPDRFLVRSRSLLYDYITKGPGGDDDEGQGRFQSDLQPYRRETNAFLSLVKGTKNPKRPADL
ncbi:hypothetical protein [Pseudobacteriovorax antillogorgiicola]|uniref:hypothetical protein n=1 Tax=Pseudobacteriovorax antillogorgiicola TaxID=1513793 RepID=UPI001A9E975C|nr:hypothetical protein [Pseudobacteriovorax antillogorgiicola]